MQRHREHTKNKFKFGYLILPEFLKISVDNADKYCIMRTDMNKENFSSHSLLQAWGKVLKQSGSLMDRQGLYVTVPANTFELFNREFNISFIKEEDDIEFQSWKDSQE